MSSDRAAGGEESRRGRRTRTPIPKMVRDEAHSGNMLIGFEMFPWTTIGIIITYSNISNSWPDQGCGDPGWEWDGGTHSSDQSFVGGNLHRLLRTKEQRSRWRSRNR